MKYMLTFLMAYMLFSCGSGKDVASPSSDNYPWSFEEIEAFIHEEFPEAYDQFLNISFSRETDRIVPEKATFLIPARYFDEGVLTKELCEERLKKVLVKMGDHGSCEQVDIGETQQYAWLQWEDKVVKKVTLYFAIGC